MVPASRFGRVRSLLALAALLATFTPIHAQKLSRVDLERKRVDRELRKLTGRTTAIDKRTLEILRARLMGDARIAWDRAAATDRIAGALLDRELPASLAGSSPTQSGTGLSATLTATIQLDKVPTSGRFRLTDSSTVLSETRNSGM